MTKFIDLDEVLKIFTPEEQLEIREGSQTIILSHQMSMLKGDDVEQLASDLKEFGATLFVRMPSGKEVEMPIPGCRA